MWFSERFDYFRRLKTLFYCSDALHMAQPTPCDQLIFVMMRRESRPTWRNLAHHEKSRGFPCSSTATRFLWSMQTILLHFLTFRGQSRVPTMHRSNFAPKSNINKPFDSCHREDWIEKFYIYLVLWPSRGIDNERRSHALLGLF